MPREGGLVKRAVFLATVALLAMLILVRVTMAQGADGSAAPTPQTTMVNGSVVWMGEGVGGNMGTTVVGDGIPAGSPSPIPSTGGSSIVLPAVALLLGSGILTYAFLRRR
jgi:hypothetical protein